MCTPTLVRIPSRFDLRVNLCGNMFKTRTKAEGRRAGWKKEGGLDFMTLYRPRERTTKHTSMKVKYRNIPSESRTDGRQSCLLAQPD